MAAGEVMDLDEMARQVSQPRRKRARARTALYRVVFGFMLLAIGSIATIPSSSSLNTPIPDARAADPFACPVPFAILEPSDGETMSATCSIRVDHCLADFGHFAVEYDGIELDLTPVGAAGTHALLDTTLLPNGSARLSVKAYDRVGVLVTAANVDVVVSNPVLAVSHMDTGQLELELSGLPSDMIFVILVSDRLRDSYFAEYGLTLPIQKSSSWILAAGGYPVGYDGSDLSLSTPIPPTPSPELYAVLLSWSPGGWLSSRPVVIQP